MKSVRLIDKINTEVLGYQGIKFEKREVYAVDYVENLLLQYRTATNLDITRFVIGRGHRR